MVEASANGAKLLPCKKPATGDQTIIWIDQDLVQCDGKKPETIAKKFLRHMPNEDFTSLDKTRKIDFNGQEAVMKRTMDNRILILPWYKHAFEC